MPALKIPIKATAKEAKVMIASKLKSKDLALSDERKLREQYMEYAKGGDVAKAPSKKQQTKVGKVMKEFKEGTLHSGAGKKAPVVKGQKQAIAIALSEAGLAKKAKKK